jgi:MFS family permease
MMTVLPALASGILGGVLVDRLGGRRMSVVSDIISGIAVLLIPLLYQTVGLGFWSLMLLVFVGAALDIPGVTARRLLLPELAEGANMRDEAISSAYETMQGASWIVGPALAGVLIAWIGTVNLLWVTAAGFLVSAICVGLFSPSGKHDPDPDGSQAATGAIAEMMAGFRYLRTDSLLLSLAFGLTMMNFLNGPYWAVVLPVQIEDMYGVASRFGLMLTALGIGNLAGGLLYGAVGHLFRGHRRAIYLIGVASFPVMLWVFVAGVPYPLMLVSGFMAGVLSGPINPLLVTVRLERIPKELRGRVFATFSGLAGAATPLGMVLAGWLLEMAGIQAGLILLAAVATLFTLGLWLTGPLWAMNVSPPIEEIVVVAGTSRRTAPDQRMDSEPG